MRRSILITLSTLGVLISLLGSTGLFAALVDTADTGSSFVESKPIAGSADLKLAQASGSSCGTFDDDLATGLFSATNLEPNGGGPYNVLCVKNEGSQTVDLTVSVFDLVDSETGCTGDEQDYGDAPCGTQGELSGVLIVRIFPLDCATNDSIAGTITTSLATMVGTPADLLDLTPGQITCYGFIPALPDYPVTPEVQRAQSDRSTWRFRFTGTAPAAP